MDETDEKTPLLKSSETDEKDAAVYTNGKLISSGDSNDSKKSEDENSSKTATFGELFSYATCLDRILMLVGAIFAIASGAAWPVMSIIFGDMTDTFIGGTTNKSLSNSNTSSGNTTVDFEEQMTKYAIYYVIIGASVWVSSFIQISFWTVACERQTHKIRKAFFWSILRQDQAWFDKHQSGELTTRLADDLERVREGLGDKFCLCLQFVSQFLSGFVIGFIKSWKLTLVMMSLTPALAVCGAFIAKVVASFSKREQTSYAEAGGIAEEVLSCIRTVTSFNGQQCEIDRYSRALKISQRLGIKKSIFVGLGTGITMFFIFSAYALAFWFGSTLIYDYYNGESGGLVPGTVMTVFFAVMIASMSLGNASPHASAVATAKGAAAVVLEIIRRVPPIDSSSNAGRRPDSVKGQIDFVGVDFSYPTRPDAKVLRKFNLSIEPGQTVALVGSSGCGKSTTVNMIQRFYDPLVGSVYLDGHNLKELNIKWLRQNIGVVSQEPILFGRTIAENIRLGDPTVTYDQIVAAAKSANAHDFISNLPKGYDTLVGERGAQLSGGQKQRVAIARALVRNPRILLLDEATSALDSSSEKVVQDALEKARAGRTSVVVAHRLSTIQNADVIYVLENGLLVEHGKHMELMDKKGVYYQLVTLQTIAEMKENGDEEVVAIVKDPIRQRKLSRHLSRHLSRQESQSTKEVEEDEDISKPNFFRIFRENAPEWPFIAIGSFAAAINGSVMPLFAVFFSEVIKTFSKKGEELKEDGLFWSMMFLALGGLTLIVNFIQTSCYGASGEKMTARLRLLSFKSMVRQDITYYDDPKHSTGALTTRLATDASNVKNATGMRAGIIIQSLVSVIAGMAIAFIFGWKLALVILAAIPIMAVAGAFHMKALTGGQKKGAELLEEAGKTASEAVENNLTVQSLTREGHFYDRYCSMLQKPYRKNISHAFFYAMAYGFSQGIIFMLYGASFRFGAYLVANGEMEYDKVYRVFFAIAFTGMSVGQASSFLPDYSKAKLSAAYIFQILDTLPAIDVFSGRGQRLTEINGEIEFRNVHFKYPLRPNLPVLQGISFNVKPGQTVALVGVSGCGKSTVVSLLQRYYDPSSGEIFIDGVNIKDMNLLMLRSFISVVSQEPILFDCSIKDNIKYGLDEDIDMNVIIQAARAANAHDFIISLPLGYDTMVGEKGAQLSGGQKQRVAIARALIRNPRVLLLDEATSALDTESEKVVQTALDNAQEGRTCIVIAHRLSTIQNADVIFIIENGNILEQGNHQELLEKNGAYAALVKGQKFNQS